MNSPAAKIRLPGILIVLVFVLSACAATTAQPASESTASPTLAPSATPVPSATATATPYPAVGFGSALPVAGLAPITKENVTKLAEIANYPAGAGSKTARLLTPDGRYILVDGTDVIETDNQQLVAKLPTFLDVSEDGSQFLVADAGKISLLGLDGQSTPVPFPTEQAYANFRGYVAALSAEARLVAILMCDAANGSNCRIVVSSIDGGKAVASFPAPPVCLWCKAAPRMAFSKGGAYLQESWNVFRMSDQKHILTIGPGQICAVGPILSPDGKMVAAIINDEVKVWALDTAQTIHTVQLHKMCDSRHAVLQLKFSRDSQKMLILKTGEVINLWNLADGALLSSQPTDLKTLDMVMVGGDGRIQVVPIPGAQPSPLDSIEFEAPYCSNTPGTCSPGQMDLALAPDGKSVQVSARMAYTTSQDQKACVVGLQGSVTCKEFTYDPTVAKDYRYALLGNDGQLYALARHFNHYTVSNGVDGSGATLGEFNSQSEVSPAILVPGAPLLLYFDPSSNRAVITNFQKSRDLTALWSYYGLLDDTYSVSADHNRLAVFNTKNAFVAKNWTIDILDTRSLETLSSLPLDFLSDAQAGAYQFVSRFALSSDGKRLAVIVSSVQVTQPNASTTLSDITARRLIMLDVTSGKQIYAIDLPALEGAGLMQRLAFSLDLTADSGTAWFTFSPDDRMLALASPGRISFLDAGTGALIHSIGASASSFAFSADSKLLAVNSGVTGMTVWGVPH